MPRFEVRFYDAVNQIKVAVELTAADPPGAEQAAKDYIWRELSQPRSASWLLVGAVRQLT